MELLLGTLPHLGFSLHAKQADGTTAELLTTGGDKLPPAKGAIVRLPQSVKLPPHQKKVVRAQVDGLDTFSQLALFEPGDSLLSTTSS